MSITTFVKSSEKNSQVWDNFVTNNNGSIYQLFSWGQICQKVYGYQPIYLQIRSDNRLIGILPAVVRGTFHPKLVSLPFVDEAGWLAKDTGIVPKLIDWTSQNYPDFEIFTSSDTGNVAKGLLPVAVYQIFTLKTVPDYKKAFDNYHHKTKNIVRKAQKMGFTGSIEKTTPELVRQFAQLYIPTMQKVGTLTLSTNFFAEITAKFPESSRFSIARHNGSIAAMLWLFIFNGKVYVWANAYDEKKLADGANYCVYNQAIKFACENGFNEIVLGASDPSSPQAFFKLRWGAAGNQVYLYSSKAQEAQGRWALLGKSKKVLRIMPTPLYTFLSDIALRYFS